MNDIEEAQAPGRIALQRCRIRAERLGDQTDAAGGDRDEGQFLVLGQGFGDRVELAAPADHAGQFCTVTGPQTLSPGEQTETLTEIVSRPLRFEGISAEQPRADRRRFGVAPEPAAVIMAPRGTALESFASVVHPMSPPSRSGHREPFRNGVR